MARKNALYAQSGGVTAVINASACGVLETAREHSDEIGTDDSGDDSECDKACDQASQDFADSPDYPGEGAWVCDCTMTDAGPMTVIQGVPDKDVEQ
jgi:hypothetical protein